MTYHIEFRDNRPVLYTSPKPEFTGIPNSQDERDYHGDINVWHTTFHSLLVEPEFKAGDIVYYKEKPRHSWYTKLKLGKKYNKASLRFNALDGHKGFGIIEETKISHYHPGQKLESPGLVWVKKVDLFINSEGGGYWDWEWQQTEEPEEYTGHEIPENINRDYAAFRTSVEQGTIQRMEKKYLENGNT